MLKQKILNSNYFAVELDNVIYRVKAKNEISDIAVYNVVKFNNCSESEKEFLTKFITDDRIIRRD
jgi:ribosomal protein S6